MIINADARNIPLRDGSMHCIITSPPYYGLRDYGVRGQIGREHTVGEYIDNLRSCAREWWRVLRDDGTLWLNLGDSYAGSGRGVMGDGSPSDRKGAKQGTNRGTTTGRFIKPALEEAKPKDLYGIPWAVAFALRADGWYLRRDIIWSKRNPMPESVTDRPTTAHEYIFLLTKSARYYYDAEAIKEPALQPIGEPRLTAQKKASAEGATTNGIGITSTLGTNQGDATRNARSVWELASQPYAGAHFATMPPALAEKCILAGTSARGCCPKCGAPYERITRRAQPQTRAVKSLAANAPGQNAHGLLAGARVDIYPPTETIGWEPACDCSAGEPEPCKVLDPFAGSGTTIKAALELGRRGFGVELNREYIRLAEERLAETNYGFAF